ncbi:MAG TPA: monooxygenase [Thermopetrobacter sp.]|nr:monooxygenase [Thermopetrobacter sp.]
MASVADDILHNNKVGPVLRAGELAQAAAEAAEIDNPGKEVTIEDKMAYLRIMADDELVLTQDTLSECLGRDMNIRELEVDLSSFAGQIEWRPDKVRFYFEKHL